MSKAETLTKICARFRSENESERATAALLADEMVQKSGLTWGDVIVIPDKDQGQSSTEQESSGFGKYDDHVRLSSGLGILAILIIAIAAMVWSIGAIFYHMATLSGIGVVAWTVRLALSLAAFYLMYLAVKWHQKTWPDYKNPS